MTDEGRPSIPPGYSAPLDPRPSRLLIDERIANLAAAKTAAEHLDLDALEAAEKAVDRNWSVMHTDEASPMTFIASLGDVICVPDPNFEPGDDATEKRFTFIVALRNAAPALIALARRAQQDASREATHAPDCHLWGRRHYDCLMREYEASRAENARLREALEAACDLANWAIGIVDIDGPVFRGVPARDALAKGRAALGKR